MRPVIMNVFRVALSLSALFHTHSPNLDGSFRKCTIFNVISPPRRAQNSNLCGSFSLKSKFFLKAVILAALFLLLPALPALAADIEVDATCTLNDAITIANGDPRPEASECEDGSASGQAAPAPLSTCLTLDGIAAYNLSESTQCQRVNAMQIANPDIKEGDFVDAVDVWPWVTPDTQICFEAKGGAFKFINTAVIPRTISDWPAFARDGMTCASIDGPGMLILLPGEAPETSAPASQQRALIARRLENCMVTATASLNLRVRPHGRVYGGVARGWTLTATARTDDWFQVDRLGLSGWIAAMYVAGEGDCG